MQLNTFFGSSSYYNTFSQWIVVSDTDNLGFMTKAVLHRLFDPIPENTSLAYTYIRDSSKQVFNLLLTLRGRLHYW